MNTEFNLNTVSFADPSGSDPFRPRSVLVSLLQLLSKGFREIWAGYGYVRSLDRAAGLPPLSSRADPIGGRHMTRRESRRSGLTRGPLPE